MTYFTNPDAMKHFFLCWVFRIHFERSFFSSSNHENLGESEKCYIIDFHSAQFLSPATDLAHLLLTSTSREYLKQHYNEVVQHYYNVFNRTLAEFGLVLRHLGTTYQDFLYEVKRALRGQFLCVAFIIPIGEISKWDPESESSVKC